VHHVIPLHCLVLCETAERLVAFDAHEITDLATISNQLVGSARRHDLISIMYNELRHRVALKLSLGERAVVPMQDLTLEQRRQLVAMATSQGAAVYTIGQRAEAGTTHVRPGAAIQPVRSLPDDINTHLHAQHWAGITVIGDVHGELEPLEQALDWARSRQHFVWLLGDVIDYGKQTLEVAEVVHHAVMNGEASMIFANHERKIARWLEHDNDHLRISDGNRITIAALEQLSVRERARWTGRFRGLLAHTALSQTIGDITLMHAAAHPSLWGVPDQRAIEQFALYGESDQSSGRFKRTHRWVDAVPHGKMVIVGHDIVSDLPMMITGAKGGKVVFLDTGCGKGGKLSSADLRFSNNTLTLECFKRH
jgi:hypothetical protein